MRGTYGSRVDVPVRAVFSNRSKALPTLKVSGSFNISRERITLLIQQRPTPFNFQHFLCLEHTTFPASGAHF
eukprot:682368-Amphidinium_carterae.2